MYKTISEENCTRKKLPQLSNSLITIYVKPLSRFYDP